MKPGRRRKHKYYAALNRFCDFWCANNKIVALAIHLYAINRFPNVHPPDCIACEKLEEWILLG